MKSTSIGLCLFAFCMWSLACISALWGDPPNRVGRLNFVTGTVSFHPESVNTWAPATLNYPLTIGDHLRTDRDGQAEVRAGSTVFRLASNTEMSFLNLNDQAIQIRHSTGSLNFRLLHLGPSEAIEVDTPNASLSLLQIGSYRIDVQQSGDTTVTVRSGEVEVTAGSSVFSLRLGQAVAITGVDSPSYHVTGAPPLDDWDRWCQARDQEEDRIASAQYVPPDEMSGGEDLDQYGGRSDDNGPVWASIAIEYGTASSTFGLAAPPSFSVPVQNNSSADVILSGSVEYRAIRRWPLELGFAAKGSIAISSWDLGAPGVTDSMGYYYPDDEVHIDTAWWALAAMAIAHIHLGPFVTWDAAVGYGPFGYLNANYYDDDGIISGPVIGGSSVFPQNAWSINWSTGFSLNYMGFAGFQLDVGMMGPDFVAGLGVIFPIWSMTTRN